MKEKIEINGLMNSVMSFSLSHNGVSLIRNITIRNLTDFELTDMKMKISFNPTFADVPELTIERINANEAIELSPVLVSINEEYLHKLEEIEKATVKIDVISGEEVLLSYNDDIDLLGYDYWTGTSVLPESLCSFIQPQHPKVLEFIEKAKNNLAKKEFTGYLTQNIDNVRDEVRAIYQALKDEKVKADANFSNLPGYLKITAPHNVLEQKKVLDLEVALLFASCLESVGLNPLIVFSKTVSIGCWLEQKTFTDCLIDEPTLIAKRLVPGIDEIILVELNNEKFEEACNLETTLQNFEFLIDVIRSRGNGVIPSPVKNFTDEGYEMIDYGMGKELNFVKKEEDKKLQLTKQGFWERKLLDLSLRNPLLNFRATRNSVQIIASDLARLEDELYLETEFSLDPCMEDNQFIRNDLKIFDITGKEKLVETIFEGELKSSRIRTFLEASEIDKTLKIIQRTSKSSLEENGANTLYLALGFLRWYENDISEKAHYAPLVLLPIDLTRNVSLKSYTIRIRDEEPQMNITLLELLRQDYGVNITGLDPLPMDENGVDLKQVFQTIRQGVISKSKWDVEELAFIGIFSFSQFIMWNDIRNRSDELKKNKVVSSLIEGKMIWEPLDDCLVANELDEKLAPSDLAIPSSADSSQLVAICAAAKGQSFVLHGAPGTGKSQTITNIIANALYQGKTVLFVAEKMAALSVVQRRLTNIGLGAFSLELHSNKAQKRTVLDHLQKTLDIGRIKEPEEYQKAATHLHSLRQDLNDEMKQMHKMRDCGKTLYELISKYEELKLYRGIVNFDKNIIKNMNSNTYSDWKSLVYKLKAAGRAIGGIKNSHFQLFENREYSLESREKLTEVLKEYLETTTVLEREYIAVCHVFEMEPRKTFFNLNIFDSLMDVVTKAQGIIKSIVMCDSLGSLDSQIRKIIKFGLDKEAIESDVLSRFTPSIWNYDVEQAMLNWKQTINTWFLPRYIKQRKLYKELSLYAKSPKSFSKKEIFKIYEQIAEFNDKIKFIKNVKMTLYTLLEDYWQFEDTNFTLLSSVYNSSFEAHSVIDILDDDTSKLVDKIIERLNDSGIEKENLFEKIRDLSKRFHQYIAQEKMLVTDYKINIVKMRDSIDWFNDIKNAVNIWLQRIGGLKDWTVLLGIVDELNESGLVNLTTPYLEGKITEFDLMERYEANLCFALSMDIINSVPCLSRFNGSQFENSIERYIKILSDFEVLTVEELVAKLSAKIPVISGRSENASELSILRKAIRSGGRNLTIRKLFDAIPTLLRRITPCMLMSPMSVAQYINPEFPKFDLVVFDEASQLPTCEAVGAIARGENVVVVGDPNQLPPTSFFSARRTDEDNQDIEDLESVLDDCLAISMPQEHLLWHYRSRHESLIAYSNAKYYENKLFTFPSPNDLTSEVKWVHVEGYYDKGSTRQNRQEAEAIVAEISRRLSDEELRKNSIGVVTFSSTQQSLIEDLLEDEFRKKPELELINNQSEEPIIIKNLENVQGDERDVILFSIGYGPDKNGKLTMNFGPLNNDGGWRRLNVAITRSRKSMIVYSTIRPEQIDLARTNAEGVVGLRGFLEFAAKGNNALAIRNGKSIERTSALEKIIASRINDLGYDTRVDIGCSEYKIDIGVVNPNNPNEYVLGIMCDGDSYRMAATSRDRNILQPSVLRGLGWSILRVWILDWLDNEDKVIEEIRLAILDALEGKKKELKLEKRDINLEKETALDDSVPYIAAKINVDGNLERFYLQESENEILHTVLEIIEVESPISFNVLKKRCFAAWGVKRVTPKANTVFDNIVKTVRLNKTTSHGQRFIWRKDQNPDDYKIYRVPNGIDDKIVIDDICSKELINAMKSIVINSGSISKDDLVKTVAKTFGFNKLTISGENAIASALLEAVNAGVMDVSLTGDKVIAK